VNGVFLLQRERGERNREMFRAMVIVGNIHVRVRVRVYARACVRVFSVLLAHGCSFYFDLWTARIIEGSLDASNRREAAFRLALASPRSLRGQI